jgi:hypothetical protein
MEVERLLPCSQKSAQLTPVLSQLNPIYCYVCRVVLLCGSPVTVMYALFISAERFVDVRSMSYLILSS